MSDEQNPTDPVNIYGDTSEFARSLGIAPEVYSRHGLRRIPPAAHVPGELRKLGFSREADREAKNGALLIPIMWRNGDKIEVVNHRLRLDHPKSCGKYMFPAGKGRVLHGAYGLLLEGVKAWLSREVPLIICEGEKKALCVASFVGDRYGIISAPGIFNQAEPRSGSEKNTRYPKRLREDFRAIELRKRKVIWIGDRDAIDGSKRSVTGGTDESCLLLRQQGADVFETFPPPGFASEVRS
jgi:hypothetical protein